MEENNRVLLVGTVSEDFVLDHEIYGEKFYSLMIATKRASGAIDFIPVLVSERLFDVNESYYGKTVQIMGEYRSRNSEDRKLRLNVFANSFEVVSCDAKHINEIYMEGFICKEPKYRITPLGRQIAEIILAVNRRYDKSDYLPCIAWGRNASFVSRAEVGTKLAIEGRIQSREYKKVIDGKEEYRVAYEISVGWLQVQGENNE